jgi:hypothetical protein
MAIILMENLISYAHSYFRNKDVLMGLYRCCGYEVTAVYSPRRQRTAIASGSYAFVDVIYAL